MDEVTKAINHFSVLMEDQNAKLDAVLEGINSLPTRDDFHRLEQRLDTVESDVQVIKAVVTATNHDKSNIRACQHMWRMGMRDSSKCTQCGCDLLAVANKSPVSGVVAAIQFVRRVTGKHMFICWRCADERYKARHVRAC